MVAPPYFCDTLNYGMGFIKQVLQMCGDMLRPPRGVLFAHACRKINITAKVQRDAQNCSYSLCS